MVAEKRKQTQVNRYLDLLVHYDANLTKIGHLLTVVRCTTGAELPMVQKGKLEMANLLLNEFGSVEAVNQRIESYRASHS
jgi:hypothetical protein